MQDSEEANYTIDKLSFENRMLREKVKESRLINEEHKKLNGELRIENRAFEEIINNLQIRLTVAQTTGERLERQLSAFTYAVNSLIHIRE
tara:strand:+ start:471 stop:740 length:270 start_codon:yes stop_codon:yes gene_type:complete